MIPNQKSLSPLVPKGQLHSGIRVSAYSDSNSPLSWSFVLSSIVPLLPWQAGTGPRSLLLILRSPNPGHKLLPPSGSRLITLLFIMPTFSTSSKRPLLISFELMVIAWVEPEWSFNMSFAGNSSANLLPSMKLKQNCSPNGVPMAKSQSPTSPTGFS